MNISHWQKEFVRTTYKKFKCEPPQRRLERFLGNVRDAKRAVLLRERIITTASIPVKRRKKLRDYKHRIAAVFPDLFLLCDLYAMDLDHELKRVLAWFKKQPDLRAKVRARTRAS